MRLIAARRGIHNRNNQEDFYKSNASTKRLSNGRMSSKQMPKSSSFFKKPISEYIFARPSRMIPEQLTRRPEHAIASGILLTLAADEFSSHCVPIQHSYIDSKQVEPYIALKSIDELFDSLQERVMKDSPFVRHSKHSGLSLLEFINFFCESWIKASRVVTKGEGKKGIRRSSLISMIKGNAKSGQLRMLSKKAAISNFEECIKMFREKERIKKLKQEFRLDRGREKSDIEKVREIIDPKIPGLNAVKDTKELFKRFYIKKQRLQNEMKSKLNYTISERGFTVKIKRNCLNQDSATVQNLKSVSRRLRNRRLLKVDSLRVFAEKRRLREFRATLENSGRLYYRTILKMMMRGLSKTECLSKLANTMKAIIERGIVFEAKHLLALIGELQVDRMSFQEKK